MGVLTEWGWFYEINGWRSKTLAPGMARWLGQIGRIGHGVWSVMANGRLADGKLMGRTVPNGREATAPFGSSECIAGS